MKKLIMGSASALVLITGLSAGVNAQGQPEPPTDYRYKYVVKFVCGFVEDGNKLIGGEYLTAINIYNPHENLNVNWEWDVSTTHGASDVASPETPDPFSTGGAFEIDCDFLLDYYAEGYAKGFVVIWSRWSLDVAAVYTAGSGADEGTAVSSIDVEYVLGHRLGQGGGASKPEY